MEAAPVEIEAQLYTGRSLVIRVSDGTPVELISSAPYDVQLFFL